MSRRIKYISFTWRWLKNRINKKTIYTRIIRHRFKKLETRLDPRVEIKNPQCISIGKSVSIQPYTWICAMIDNLPRKNVFNPSIQIGENTTIGRFCQITISNELIIENDVLITEGVLISDALHQYKDVNIPVKKQPLVALGPIIIKEGAWIANGARIFGAVTIGKNSVVGANAYVDKDVPDYCVVAGIPAQIIKRYDFEQKRWVRCKESE